MAKFLSELKLCLLTNSLWELCEPLIYESDILKCTITVPKGFKTDLASVPRFPIAYWFWGGREHREAVIHDYLYCIDSVPVCTYSQANDVFLEAAKSRGKSALVRYPMWFGVCIGGWTAFHKRKVSA